MKLFVFSFVLLGIAGCVSSEKRIEKIYERRQEILSIFNNVSVFRKGISDKVIVYTYSIDKRNEYIFEKKHNGYSLFKDNVVFTPDNVLNVNKPELGDSLYSELLKDKLDFYLRKMDSLRISDISREFIRQGIDFKIYLKPSGVMLYVSNENDVTNQEWRKYIGAMKKIDNNWLYSMKDE